MEEKERDVIYFDNPYWPENYKISYLQRRIIVHSILYYELNNSIIGDLEYDGISRQLVRLTDGSDLDECEKSTYWYCMKDFDGTTGFDLYNRLNKHDKKHLLEMAHIVLDCYVNKKYERSLEAARNEDKIR